MTRNYALGGHVWCDEDELILANTHLAAQSGAKTLCLLEFFDVFDVQCGAFWNRNCDATHFDPDAPHIRPFRLKPQP